MRFISPNGNMDADIKSIAAEDYSPCFYRGEIAGCFLPSPEKAITDIYSLSVQALAQGRVLLLYLDGLGYSLYERAELPFIRSQFHCVPARTAFPPVTQPCMASMLTGVWPDEHGVLSRRQHRPKVPSLMKVPGAVLIEGDEELLDLETPPILTLPRKGENADQAVLRTALPYVQGDSPLVIVHFHGLDDLEHEKGDDENALSEKLLELDSAVGRLCESFYGTAILVADHGAHGDSHGGSHGEFDYRDMYVPLGVTQL